MWGTDDGVRSAAMDFGFTLRPDLSIERVIALARQAEAAGEIIGWMQGRAEFGPRALGNRSILADPRSPTMKDAINGRVVDADHHAGDALQALLPAMPAWGDPAGEDLEQQEGHVSHGWLPALRRGSWSRRTIPARSTE